MSPAPLFLILVAASCAAFAGDPLPNTLTDTERAEGWRLLFDGKSAHGWRAFRGEAFPERGWVVEDGCLRHVRDGKGGDLVTVETFLDYEFHFDWLIEPEGNGGVKYFIDERRGEAIGHEYQLLGPRTVAEAMRDMKRGTASFYDVLPASTNALPRTPGEWNHSRILVHGTQVEHWLNGKRVLAYDLESDAVRAGIAASKFKDVSGFGTKFAHPILLQDHGGDIRFRNLKLRLLRP